MPEKYQRVFLMKAVNEILAHLSTHLPTSNKKTHAEKPVQNRISKDRGETMS